MGVSCFRASGGGYQVVEDARKKAPGSPGLRGGGGGGVGSRVCGLGLGLLGLSPPTAGHHSSWPVFDRMGGGGGGCVPPTLGLRMTWRSLSHSA